MSHCGTPVSQQYSRAVFQRSEENPVREVVMKRSTMVLLLGALCGACSDSPATELLAPQMGQYPMDIVVSADGGQTQMGIGGELQLAAAVTNNRNDKEKDRNISWSSSDVTIATVDNTGLVSGKGLGAVVITASFAQASGSYAIS